MPRILCAVITTLYKHRTKRRSLPQRVDSLRLRQEAAGEYSQPGGACSDSEMIGMAGSLQGTVLAWGREKMGWTLLLDRS